MSKEPQPTPEQSARMMQVRDLVAAINDTVFEVTGQHVLLSGHYGNLTPQGGKVARLLDYALTDALRAAIMEGNRRAIREELARPLFPKDQDH